MCRRWLSTGNDEGLELAAAVISCFQAVLEANALLRVSGRTADIDEAVVVSAEDVSQTTAMLRM